MKKHMSRIALCAVFALILMMTVMPFAAAADTSAAAEAAEAAADPSTSAKAIAAAAAIGVASVAGAVSMGHAIAKSSEGISRQPEAAGQIRTSLMLGLVFIETAIIYALIVAILIVFVL